MTSTRHTHHYQGQTLAHSHPGGSVPHGYYGHAEDLDSGSIEPGELYVDSNGVEVRRETGKDTPRLRDSDQLVRHLGPDADLVIDAGRCIVIATPERRITVSNVATWRDELLAAKMRVAQLEQARRQARPGPLEWHKGTHGWEIHDGYPRHAHSENGVLTIDPHDSRPHFAHGPQFGKGEEKGP